MKNPHKRRQRKNRLQAKRRHWRRQNQHARKNQSLVEGEPVLLGSVIPNNPPGSPRLRAIYGVDGEVRFGDGRLLSVVWDPKTGDARVATDAQRSYSVFLSDRGRKWGKELMANNPAFEQAIRIARTRGSGGKAFGKGQWYQQLSQHTHLTSQPFPAWIEEEESPPLTVPGPDAPPDELGYLEGFRMWYLHILDGSWSLEALDAPYDDLVLDPNDPNKAIGFSGESSFKLEREQTVVLGSYNDSYGAWNPGENRFTCMRYSPGQFENSEKHEVPDPNCQCGFWAVSDYIGIGHAVHIGGFGLSYGRRNYITGKIEAWGTIVETTQGFRAEKARIKELYLNEMIADPRACELAKMAAERYKVPLGILTVEDNLDTSIQWAYVPDD